VVAVAAPDVAAEGAGDVGVAGVVGGVEHELSQGLEVALDPVQVAGGGGRGDQFDVAARRPGFCCG
jgi:hypothetical protein